MAVNFLPHANRQPRFFLAISLGAMQFCLLQLWVHYTLSRQHEVLHNTVDDSRMLIPVAGVLFKDTDFVRNYAYRSASELARRSKRFPSVDKRLKVYLSSWYAPPLNDTHYVLYHEYSSNGTTAVRELDMPRATKVPAILPLDKKPIRSRTLFILDKDEIEKCKNTGDSLCRDVATFILPALRRLDSMGQAVSAPIILQFGDAEEWHTFNPRNKKNESYPIVPLIKKFRTSMSRETIDRITDKPGLHVEGMAHSQPIVSIACNYNRHFGQVREIPRIDTVPWSKKKDKAIWRGALTGRNHLLKRHKKNVSEICNHIPRCQFVQKHRDSVLVDARLVVVNDSPLPIPRRLDGYDLFVDDKLPIAGLLEYKILVVVEGNDIASGLKWSLFSESIVLMQRPRYTSWAMEELLEPWVHYVPIEADDFSDVEAKVQWILDHDTEAQEIVRNSRLWIADLAFHPLADSETEQIMEETLRRYQSHFRKVQILPQ